MEINDLFKNTSSKDIKKLIALLQVLADINEDNAENDIQDNMIKITEQKKISKSKSQNTKKKNNKPKFENKFLDMPERNMHKEDTQIDKKLSVHPPVLRGREFDPINVVCRVCGKQEEIHPSLIDSVSRYKCNNCSKNPG